MSLQLFIDAADGLIDQPRRITARGATPGIARLTATLAHPDGSQWRSQADFRIADDGRLDLDAQSPVAGDWDVPQAMACVWAMRQIREPLDSSLSESVAPLNIDVEIEDERGGLACATFGQRFLAPGVSRRPIVDAGLSGTVFLPAGNGPFPVVIVLNGSGGGTPEQRAALYAAHGYIGVALAYFKAPGRPEYISDTPLEYFQTALEWAQRSLAPRHNFIAVAGLSRGGELALLLASTFAQQVSAVIGYVPSAVVHGTLRAGRPGQARDADAWTWQGQPLPNVWRNNVHADWSAFDQPPIPGVPIRQAPAFSTVEQAADNVAAARIPVERINAPVLLISGSDDGFWPSTEYCTRIVEALSAAGHPWPAQHLCNEGAGHAIGFPYVPTTLIAKRHPVAGVVISGGGTALANAQANRRSWDVVLAFLDRAVSAQGERP